MGGPSGNMQQAKTFFLYESLKDPEKVDETRINGELLTSTFGDIFKEATGSFFNTSAEKPRPSRTSHGTRENSR